MSQGALAVTSKYSLEPSKKIDGWSKFVRGASASNIFTSIPLGRYLEVSDKKFNGDSLVIFRRTDFDNLNMLSSIASKVSRYLMQIDRITTTFADAEDPKKVIQLIHEEARMGIEYVVVRSTSSANDYFKTALTSEEDYSDMPLPVSRRKK